VIGEQCYFASEPVTLNPPEAEKPRLFQCKLLQNTRKKSNLSRTLKTMSNYDLVDMREKERIHPVVKAPAFQVEFDIWRYSA